MTYVGGFAGAVIGLFLRYPLRGRLPDARIFLIQEALFVFGVGVGLFLDVREACMEAAEHQVVQFLRLVASGDVAEVTRCLAADSSLARTPAIVGATRTGAAQFFIAEIAHYVYAGDTPLHIAAAAFRGDVAALLITHGADCRARNRRGAQPLHYAADANRWSPAAQSDVIVYLTSVGADANATDKSGVAPLHRAIRTRSLPAVQVLLTAGADPNQQNGSGSTPLHLAVRTAGRGGSGTDLAREQQEGIVRLLITVGARPTDRDGRGTTALNAAPNARVRAWLT